MSACPNFGFAVEINIAFAYFNFNVFLIFVMENSTKTFNWFFEFLVLNYLQRTLAFSGCQAQKCPPQRALGSALIPPLWHDA